MNQAIAKRWVKALRSGKHKQAKEYLKVGKGYCCLGVLQECVLGIPIKKPGHDSTLSQAALVAADMRQEDGALSFFDSPGIPIGERMVRSLAEANDYGKSFKSIANWIEKNWQRL